MSKSPSTNENQVDINLTPVSTDTKKPVPDRSKLGLVCHYSPSADGVDENLLVLLHGYGDTHVPFASLGQKLRLPQTATLAIRGPEPLPYLLPSDPPAYQYFPLYNLLGEPIAAPNPTGVLASLIAMLTYLIRECRWAEERIHLFGFGQGGSVAVELARTWAKEHAESLPSTPVTEDAVYPTWRGILGSVVTISGPLLSHPTPYAKSCLTPLLVVHRPRSQDSALSAADIRALKRAFGERAIVEEIGDVGQKEGMPASREEWLRIMRFWSDALGRRVAGEGIYRVG